MEQKGKLTMTELPRTRRMQVDEAQCKVKKIQDRALFDSERETMQQLAALYGSAFPMMLRYEREVLGQPERLPGLPSSFTALESHMNRLNQVTFEDCLNKGRLNKRLTAHEYFDMA